MTARVGELWSAVVRWCIDSEQSTRSAGILRILLVILVWARWAKDMRYFQDITPFGFAFMTAFYTATCLMLVGLFTRLSSAAVGILCMTIVYYLGFAVGHEPWTHHHTRLLAHAAMLAAFMPCGKSYSLDRWLEVRRAERAGRSPSPERGNIWALRLVALQLSVMYVFAVIDKLGEGFMSGARMQHYLLHYYTGSDMPDSAWLEPACLAFAWTTIVLEAALAIGMLSSRGRRWLLLPGLFLHGAFYVLLSVSTFSMTVWALYVAYFEPDEVHDAIDRLHGQGGPAINRSA
ncbi:MAG: HTTM domain-containing protein [Myxococcales bacterium]|nr:HTTM domain-containing protein [Myxococcales bacterium]